MVTSGFYATARPHGRAGGGMRVMAAATSLPEVSTVLSAVPLRQYEMAISDIFGTNPFDIALALYSLR